MMTSLEIANSVYDILDNKKATELKMIKIDDISSLGDYFIFATGTSSTHVNSLADELEVKLKEDGIVPQHIEGYRANGWVLIDYGVVIVHIFTPDAREYYDLDRLWQTGELIKNS